ncbi:MAG TPA: glycosyltransferase, partial [Chthonomonadaceae bacterium]|nr:glycosyltransferase [Chthonomonadaceae bacterium]
MRVVITPFNRMSDATLCVVRAAGHEVICTGVEAGSYAEIEQQHPAGWSPDVLLFWSPEYHPIPRDLESAPCFKVGVYGDWNLGGQAVQQSAAMFDLLFADPNGAERLRALGFTSVVSAPLWSFDPDLHRCIPGIERDIDILMIGNLNPDIQHDRGRWLARIARLSRRFRVLVTSGVFGEEYVRLMNRARIVFNRSIRGEINMRAYEAPACGALLFNERENRAIGELYGDRRECVLYGEDDLEDLLDYYLTHEDERAAIADAGRARVQSETPAAHVAHMFGLIGGEMSARS